MKKYLIVFDEEVSPGSLDLLEVARQMYGNEAYEVYGLSLSGEPMEAMKYLDGFIRISNRDPKGFDCRQWTKVIGEIQKHYCFDGILIPGTWMGRMLAPRLAVRLHTGLTADVTDVRHREGHLELVRPAFSGRLMAAIIPVGDGPVMLTARENVFRFQAGEEKRTQIHEYSPTEVGLQGVRLLDVQMKPAYYDICNSQILVSGGAGVGRQFQQLEALAEGLGGQLSASRQIVDQGLASRQIQVGQSGKTVSPKLYLALGIYGAIQHVEGLRQVEHIISVNTNPDAPICSLSDIVVEGDAIDFAKKLTERIRQYREDLKNK